MNTTFSFEEEAAILFTSAILSIGSVVVFTLFLLQIASPTARLDCCFCTLIKLVWKKCCKCSDLNQELKKHLKEEEETL